MGQSTNGILVFGIDYSDDESGFFDLFELDEFLMSENNINQPENSNYDSDEWKIYFKTKHQIEKNFPIDVIWHCHIDCPMHLVVIKRLSFKACRGDTLEIDMTLRPTDEEIQALKKFCAKAGLTYHQPKWMLASQWA